MTPRKTPQFGPNRASLEATVAAHPALSDDQNAAIVQLARTLAEQVDAAGDDVSSRLSAAYLSALKDLRRAVQPGAGVSQVGRSTLHAVETPREGARSWRTS